MLKSDVKTGNGYLDIVDFILQNSCDVEENQADHIIYDGKKILSEGLSEYSAEDYFNSPCWEGEIDEL